MKRIAKNNITAMNNSPNTELKIEKKLEEMINPKRRKRKAKSEISIITDTTNNTLFAILLAALSSNNFNSQFLIKKCLNRLRLSLLSQSKPIPIPIPIPIVSLLPILLKSKCGGIARRSAELVGAASLLSLEMNEQIASDAQILKGLISLLRNSNRRVLMAACNALLDLATTSLGRQCLLEFSALETLLFEFFQVYKSSTMVSLCNGDDENITSLRVGFKQDEIPVLLLDAAIILINTCNIEQLEKITRKLYECFFVCLKELWTKVRKQILRSNIMRSTQEKHFCLSSITISNLAESIFRLSINAGQLTTLSQCEMVKRSIFDLTGATFGNFMLNYWEVSPFLVRRLSNSLNEEEDIFSSYVQSLNSKESSQSLLSSILQSLISCQPIASDEFDILSFLKEVRNKLGCPLIYEQDIRVLRTEKHSKREVHFFPESAESCSIKAPYFIYDDDISKVEEAYKEGYTIAMRGIEFRFECIAAIADGLASLFGQPSVGANLYLTPPNSQGLARHYDDHCVFVCQLFGSKQWKVFSQPSLQLPRLYSSCDIVNGIEVESSMAEFEQFSLREGDVLYIPRGFPHEACTRNCGPTGSAGLSLHLTLGIEVEPPFEWEGFAHVALCYWNQANKQHTHASVESLSGILNLMSVNLLHVVIGLIGDSDPTFRKACLVAAVSLPSGNNDWLYHNQRTIFGYIVDKINAESRLSEALSIVEVGIRENEDPFQRMGWLQFLDWDGWNIPFMGVETMFPLFVQDKDVAEAAFTQVKTKFCSEILYEDVTESYRMLLNKYKKTRKQYMNGMLSLHCN